MPTQTTYSTATVEKQAHIVGRLMELYTSSPRGMGFGLKEFAYENIEKNKKMFNKGGIGWRRGEVTEEDWRLHLSGERMLGLGPILEDGKVWYASIDVDKIGNSGNYGFDQLEFVQTVYASKLPIVPSWTKSGGLRLSVFFTEPLPAELAVRFLKTASGRLGCAGNEIFPKQTKLGDGDDCPSWIFMPYGPTWDVFAEQSGINEAGGEMMLDEYIEKCFQNRITQAQMISVMGNGLDEGTTRSSGGAQRSRSNKWEMKESYAETLKMTFAKGPPCLWSLSLNHVMNYQHNFMLNCATFLMKKYPDNWDEALAWVNNAVLRPAGDHSRLQDLIKDFRRRGNQYHYTCKDEPICSSCDANMCRNQPYGVGQGGGGFDNELGLTIVERNPRLIWFNAGHYRVSMKASDLYRLDRVKDVMANAGAPPPKVSQKVWTGIVDANIETAMIIEPSVLLRTDIEIIETLTGYFGFHIRRWVRTHGEEFLAGKCGDEVRVKMMERKIFFKWLSFKGYCSRAVAARNVEIEKMRLFIADKGEYLGKDYQPGMGTQWYRSTYNLSMDLFDENVVEEWFSVPQ